MNYTCTIRSLSTGDASCTVLTVEANHPSDAAREAARIAAQLRFENGQPSFVTEQTDGTFIASIGEQKIQAGGLVTKGIAIVIAVEPVRHRFYRDDSYPERACDHCGKPYRGPAVYCSLDCAVADA